MNSSSIGSARVASGTSRPRLPRARPAAQRAISPGLQRPQRVDRDHDERRPWRPAVKPLVPSSWSASSPTTTPATTPSTSATTSDDGHPGAVQPAAYVGAQVVDEVGQPVLEEPRLRSGAGIGRGRHAGRLAPRRTWGVITIMDVAASEETVSDYLLAHSTAQDDVLARLAEETRTHLPGRLRHADHRRRGRAADDAGPAHRRAERRRGRHLHRLLLDLHRPRPGRRRPAAGLRRQR